MTEPALPRTATKTKSAPRADGLPKRAKAVPAAERPALDLARRIVELAEDKKAADIVLLDLAGLTTMADYFVICSGGSERQLGAIADGIIGTLRDEKTKPIGREGTAASHWVLVDFGAVIVHIFTPPGARLLRPRKALVTSKDHPQRSIAPRGTARARVAPLRSSLTHLEVRSLRCSDAPSPAPSGATILGT